MLLASWWEVSAASLDACHTAAIAVGLSCLLVFSRVFLFRDRCCTSFGLECGVRVFASSLFWCRGLIDPISNFSALSPQQRPRAVPSRHSRSEACVCFPCQVMYCKLYIMETLCTPPPPGGKSTRVVWCTAVGCTRYEVYMLVHCTTSVSGYIHHWEMPGTVSLLHCSNRRMHIYQVGNRVNMHMIQELCVYLYTLNISKHLLHQKFRRSTSG